MCIRDRENCMFIHVVLIPQIPGSDEYKTKPAQHSVDVYKRQI